MKYLMVRRTRGEISRFYTEDLAAQELKFPEVATPNSVFYELSRRENEIFTRTIERITQGLTYARYRPLTYFAGKLGENVTAAQFNLAGFMKKTVSIRQAKAYLEKAEEFYARCEIDAAANAVRKYYEQTIKDFCQRKRLSVSFQFQNDIGKIPASEFWKAIVNKRNSFALDMTLRREIESCQTNINNPLSHAGINNVHSTEVGRAIEKVKELNAELAAIS